MRNAKFHGKFFSMLDLAWEYWEPVGGLVPRQELRGIQGLAKYFEAQNGKPGQLSDTVAANIAGLETARAERFPAVDKSREAFREWVTIEAGHFHLVHTPEGVRKEAKSISWANMDDLAFEPLWAKSRSAMTDISDSAPADARSSPALPFSSPAEPESI